MSEKSVDERDVLTLADEREGLKRKLEESQAAHREADETARKVPHLEAELKRHEQSAATAKEREKERIKQAGDLDQQVRELQSEIRSRDDQIAQLSDELAAAEDQSKALADAHAEAADLSTCLDEALDREKTLEKEIDRLKAHEEHTKLTAKLLAQTKDLA